MYFVIRFDILPGKMSECDKYIEEELIPYFTSHEEVSSVGVLEDKWELSAPLLLPHLQRSLR